MIRIIIPARAGSKGFVGKNRKLVDYTINSIPKELLEYTYLNTDDIYDSQLQTHSKLRNNTLDKIGQSLTRNKINIYSRPKELAQDETPIQPVLQDMIQSLQWNSHDIVIMLYLTYPLRQWNHIYQALQMFQKHNAKSLLCRKPVKSHPYLCMYEDDIYGKQIVSHDLHRRQSYPTCFEICHYIAMFRVNEILKLKNNLFNEDTIYYSVPNPEYYTLDIDTFEDYQQLIKNN